MLKNTNFKTTALIVTVVVILLIGVGTIINQSQRVQEQQRVREVINNDLEGEGENQVFANTRNLSSSKVVREGDNLILYSFTNNRAELATDIEGYAEIIDVDPADIYQSVEIVYPSRERDLPQYGGNSGGKRNVIDYDEFE